MQLVVIDYGSGNLQSVLFALNRINVEAIISNDRKVIKTADKVILPGVGHAKPAMEQLEKYNLTTLNPQLKQPVLGIWPGDAVAM